MAITVSQLFRYPIKSMRGETHTSLNVTETGVTGDRVWAVRDEVRGGIRGAKKIPSLMKLAANFSGAVNTQGASPAMFNAVAIQIMNILKQSCDICSGAPQTNYCPI
jgi:uncharacterized protein YcbX